MCGRGPLKPTLFYIDMIHPERVEQISSTGICQPWEAKALAIALLKVHSRRGGPHTSRDAAKSIKNLTQHRSSVLTLFKAGKRMTDETLLKLYQQMVEKHGWDKQSDSGIRTRRAELVKLGMVHPVRNEDGAVVTERGSNGRRRIVWQLAESA